MALLVGVLLALTVAVMATAVGLDRDRAFYPTVTIVIASYYALFAVMGASLHALLAWRSGMTLRTAIGMLVALVSVAAGATSPPPLQLSAKDLGAERYAYVTKIGQLPEDIRKGLARQLEQPELQMVDAGMPFNSGDAAMDPTVPSHRLIVAAVGAKYAVVHFERGGVALTRWIVVFERTTAGLNTLWHGVINEVYRQPKELEAAIRTGALWKASTKPAR